MFRLASCSVDTGSGEWGSGPSLGRKLPGREADHSPQSGTEAKDKRSYTSIHPYAFIALGETGKTPVVKYKIRTVTVRIRVKCEGKQTL